MMPEMTFERREQALVVRLAGRWRVDAEPPNFGALESEIEAHTGSGAGALGFDARELGEWDSTLLTLLLRLYDACARRQVPVDPAGLPEGARRLLALARAVPEREGVRRSLARKPFLAHLGEETLDLWGDAKEIVAFVGEIALSFGRLLRGRARFQLTDLFLFLQQAGAGALPIVSLISLLVGLILAFVGAVQLKVFGAQMYVADLVGIGIIREMGAMMTGIIMAGRTGAAYAAQLGTMQVNEELDALKTFGIDPLDFLVLPRVIALTLMLPLLCMYADLMGVIGGAIVAVGSFDISIVEYVERLKDAVALRHFWVGIGKSAIYGVIVAGSGCLRGVRCGRSASAVGDATTSAVVTAIVWIIVWCALTTVMLEVLGI